MPLFPTWPDLLLRIALATLAGAIIGWNRGAHGRPAGLRTHLLVCLAAAFSMVLANLLLFTTGKTSESFVQMDVMRLPLGILSGIGFIGGGAILQRGDLVMGVTTAATLWFVTMMGLCFGAGELILGGIAFIIGLVVLWGLKRLEDRVQQERKATLSLTVDLDRFDPAEIETTLKGAGFRIAATSITHRPDARSRTMCYELRWMGYPRDSRVPPVVEGLFAASGMQEGSWSAQ
ncbi:MgtC/SapB family protein [Mycobacterium sp. KBS0706]|uniref:MgtC/SapB family protein n=1 Tax=Mycobacterium sp. KBS0706 TaxID=2578109 RepID=UPI00110FE19D|nr:MgtC/SapB family protein [Mycobacterium sp. KBS0706]TSD84537.1 MgtC/SapB family protein [Mycobacterium sp. KBS0706]